MSESVRRKAISTISERSAAVEDSESSYSISEIYGSDVFSIKVMKDYLSKDVYKKLLSTLRTGSTLDSSIAGSVANAMKRWAVSKGATHYTHWFQPLTGATAEKHDSFIEPDGKGGVLLDFSGKTLIQGEPDASSFPSGGLRATFEARGYTAWDPTSPAFIKRDSNGATLCIPTAFCSYTGEALDKKTPLLRSMQAVSQAAQRMLKVFGEEFKDINVTTTLGAEQEYFLIDKAFYMARPDLLQVGRTLFGTVSPKHQQLDDHYFGAIKERVINFMGDVDKELWRLGIPAKTRHNEVAPAQFEIAPQFEELNLAVDHNMMIMETLRKVAERHDFVCLMHEKPFAGVNGSGKHNNWSIGAEGHNFLNPGDNPHENAIFLTTLCAIIKAVDTHADLLRATAASAGNDHRLGANEAPPAIISIFLGEQLFDVIEQIEKGGANSAKQGGSMNIGVDALPVLPRDATDRNRTSPFAFTGNKFEFRAVGSAQSCAGANIALNTMVAEAFDYIADELEGVSKENFNSELQKLLQKIIKEHKRVIFNGDNYSAEWAEEAERRGLPNLRTTPEALKALQTEKAIALFEKYKVLSKDELKSRYEVFVEGYDMIIDIEGKCSLDISKTVILPVALEQQNFLAENIALLEDIGVEAGVAEQKEALNELSGLIGRLYVANKALEKAIASGDSAAIISEMNNVREIVDALELVVDDELWPLPKYGEMLFIS